MVEMGRQEGEDGGWGLAVGMGMGVAVGWMR